MNADNFSSNNPRNLCDLTFSDDSGPVAVMVVDHSDARPELRQVLQQNGYRVIDTDNGLDAASQARRVRPNLLVVDFDVPLLYELVAARQIVRHAQVGPMPVVIVTHEDVVDPHSMMEVGASREEYVTRLSNYQELKPLLDYLLPVLPQVPSASPSQIALAASSIECPPEISAATVRELHPHQDAAFREPDVNSE